MSRFYISHAINARMTPCQTLNKYVSVLGNDSSSMSTIKLSTKKRVCLCRGSALKNASNERCAGGMNGICTDGSVTSVQPTSFLCTSLTRTSPSTAQTVGGQTSGTRWILLKTWTGAVHFSTKCMNCSSKCHGFRSIKRTIKTATSPTTRRMQRTAT